MIADLELYWNKGLGLLLVSQGQRDLQRNFLALEKIFPYTCADFFFCLSEHKNKTKGKLWGLFNIGGVPFCESLTSTERKNMFCKVLFEKLVPVFK